MKKLKRYTQFFLNLVLFSFIFYLINVYNDSTKYEKQTVKNDKRLDLSKSLFERDKYTINCDLIFKKDENEIKKSKTILKSLDLNANNSYGLLSDSNFIFPKSNCSDFISQRGYFRFNNYTHQIELDFPIAYSILTYENTEQFERLLNAIYRPHNIYCIHIDLKSSSFFKESIRSIANCFDNVFITTKLEYIIYAGFNRLKADFNCIKDLLDHENLIDENHPNLLNKKKVAWKYLLNLASSEFPIKTNLELVQIFQLLNGSNSIYINKVHGMISHRMKNIFFNDYLNNRIYSIKKARNNKPPHSIRLVKGSAYGAFDRMFLKNIFINSKILDFIKWLKHTYSPDEFFWASLELNTHLYENSTFKDSKNANYIYDIARFNGWYGSYECGGMWRHKICVLSFEDLNRVINERSIIVNKFMLEYDPMSYQCMEEWLNRKVVEKFYKGLNETYFLKDICSLFRKRSFKVDC